MVRQSREGLGADRAVFGFDVARTCLRDDPDPFRQGLSRPRHPMITIRNGLERVHDLYPGGTSTVRH